MHTPATAEELADSLHRFGRHSRTIRLQGAGTKGLMAGPLERADETVATTGLRRVLEYEPHDLTISVEAGMPWQEFSALLAANRQMVPLDPPFRAAATVGGVVASNTCGPRRRLYGTARDCVIGMTFATLEGKLVRSGGMVVKNVAGLDMAKLMIGSFGTLAAIAVVNFKVSPAPDCERSFLISFDSAGAATAARNHILTSVLQPAAIDLLNPAGAKTLGKTAWALAVRAAGNAKAVERYERELAPLGDAVALDGREHEALWRHIEEFPVGFLARHPNSAVVRASCTLKEVERAMASFPGAAIARAGSGVCYGYFEDCERAASWTAAAAGNGWKAVVEFAPNERKSEFDLWPAPGGDFELMRRVKSLFDPENLLNRGRLYRRL